jgi:hypothetical protein
MRNKTIVFSLLALVLFLASFLMVAITFGWITPFVSIPDNEVVVGELRYTKSGAFIGSSTILIPGEEMLASTIAIANASPIESQMRVKITYTAWTNIASVITESTETYQGSSTEPLHADFATGFIYASGYWYLTSTDYVFAVNSGNQNILTSIYYDGNNTGIDFSGRMVTVTVSIEVKQADNVAWSALTSYDFSTGYPA